MIVSPEGCRVVFADAPATQTGHAVCHQYKESDAPDVLPPADAMVIAPITCWSRVVSETFHWADGASPTCTTAGSSSRKSSRIQRE